VNDTGAVVVAHGRLDLASRCVETLRVTIPPEHIVVVVNAPREVRDGQLAARLAEHVRVVSPPAPQGYGANLNFGVRLLPPGLRFAILSNDDIEFENGAVTRLREVLDANSRAGVAGPTLVDPSGSPQLSASEFPTALDALVRSAALPRALKSLVQRIDGRRQNRARTARSRVVAPDGTRSVDWVIGAAMAVRLDAFLAVNGFDERFFLYFEETDLCDRLWASGWTVLSVPDARAVHAQGQSTGNPRYQAVFREARRRYLIKRLGLARWLLVELMYPVFFVVSVLGLVTALTSPDTIAARLQAIRTSWGRRAFLLPPSRRR
jgi:N-acetylglucosaminyl-diphospho-decaprenol L-rhamnosyltransferase